MRKLGRTNSDALELLLDTVCSMFGAILLIAILAPRYGLLGAAAGNVGYLITLSIIFEVYRRLRPRSSLNERQHHGA